MMRTFMLESLTHKFNNIYIRGTYHGQEIIWRGHKSDHAQYATSECQVSYNIEIINYNILQLIIASHIG